METYRLRGITPGVEGEAASLSHSVVPRCCPTGTADFWGRRWNVTQSRILKGLLYDPIVEGRLVPEGTSAATTNVADLSVSHHDTGCGGEGTKETQWGDGSGCASSSLHPPHRPQRTLRQRRPCAAATTAASAFVVQPDGHPDFAEFCESNCCGADQGGRNECVPGYDSDGGCDGAASHSGSGGGGVRILTSRLTSETIDAGIPEAPATPNKDMANSFTSAVGGTGPRWQERTLSSVAAVVAAGVAAVASWFRQDEVRKVVALLVVFVFSGIEHEVGAGAASSGRGRGACTRSLAAAS